MRPLRFVFAAGGTAGHIEPALNVADAIKVAHPQTQIVFLGGTRGLESTLIPARGYELQTVTAVPFPRKLNADTFAFPTRLWHATKQAKAIVRGSDAVIGFGGYPAVPAYIAANRLGIPLVIHEANAKAGLANRLGARWTRHQYASHVGVLPSAQLCGLPVRAEIAHLDRAALRASAQSEIGVKGPTVLVFGGSQGAQRLNSVLAQALPSILATGVQVIHAYGTHNLPPQLQDGYQPVPYIHDMAMAYAASDLVIARAGAMTCAEVTAVGIPTVFVPLPIGNGEQRLNAQPIVDAGGAFMIDEAALTPEWLADQVSVILSDQRRLEMMSHAARELGSAESAARMAADIVAIARGESDD